MIGHYEREYFQCIAQRNPRESESMFLWEDGDGYTYLLWRAEFRDRAIKHIQMIEEIHGYRRPPGTQKMQEGRSGQEQVRRPHV